MDRKNKKLFVFELLNLLERKDGCGVIVTIPTAFSRESRDTVMETKKAPKNYTV